MSQSRHALLLAIAEYDSYPPLDYVRRDVPRMRQALDRMGVPACNIKSNGADGDQPQRDLTTNRIKKLIRDFVNGAAPDTDLIVYISCHGAEIGNHRVLIPQDFDPADASPSDLVSDIDLLGMARKSKAASVLFLIDACRDGYRLDLVEDTKSLGLIDPPVDPAPSDDSPTIAIVFSCAIGQRSGKVRDTGECSAFTLAFSEALESADGGNKLTDVIALAQPALTRYQSTDQRICLGDQRAHGRRGDPKQLVVKQGPDAAFLDRLEHSPWVGRLRKLGMWQAVNEAAPGFATQVTAIVLRAEDAVRNAGKILPRQHWRTDDVPFRMLDRIAGHLLSPTGAMPAEAAVLLAVPFVYEFVLATAATRLAAEGPLLDPLSSVDRKDTSAFWGAWRAACDNDDAGERHVKRLRERGKPEQADDYATWRLIAFCHQAGELWDAGQHGRIVRDVAAAVAPAPLRDVMSDRRVGECLTAGRLLRFTRLMFAEFEDILLEASGRIETALNRDERFGDGTGELRLDELTVVHRLNLGARLALDARRLPPLLAEHLGCDGTLTLELVQEKLQATAWHTRKTTLSLRLACPHEALDAALREAVEDLEAHLRRLRAADLIHQRALSSLPATVTAQDLTPFSLDSKPPYDTEHLRFTLDQGRIMGLLMGKELYGDPDLALRELYQNALDACRYRRAHEACRRKQAGGAFYGRDYEGLIVFRFGSENGRRYVECQDNGIGMADRHLRRLFACAGRRFTGSHEYHLDKARWEAAGIPFYPNSRFGIGVLSYFMLAEELEVESQRAARPGEPPNEPVHARVLGNGSLFRLDRDATGVIHDSGTRVRLWLEDQERPLSEYSEAILKWLWLPEFRTLLEVESVITDELDAGQPTPRFEHEMGPVIPMTGSEDSIGVPRVFWCPKMHDIGYGPRRLQSALLVGGIFVEASNRYNAGAHQTWECIPLGIAINLTEKLRADLSVDRLQILSTAPAGSFIRNCIDSGGWRSLKDWSSPNLEALLAMFDTCPLAIIQLSDALVETDTQWPVILATEGNSKLEIPSAAGICDLDGFLFRNQMREPERWLPFDTSGVSPTMGRWLSLRLAELLYAGMNLPLAGRRLAMFTRQDNTSRCHPFLAHSFGLSRRYDENPSMPIGTSLDKLTVSSFLLLATRARFSVDNVKNVGCRLNAMGISVPDLETWTGDSTVALSRQQLILLTRNLDDKLPAVDEITPIHLTLAAIKFELSIDDVTNIAQPLTVFGLSVPNLDGWTASSPLTDEQITLMSKNLDGMPLFDNHLPPVKVLRAASRWNRSPAEVINVARPLTTLGVSVPDPNLAIPWPTLDLQMARLLSNGEDSAWNDTMSLPLLAEKAQASNMSLAEALERLGPILALYPELAERISHVSITDSTEVLLRRVHSKDEYQGPHTLSCWDLAGAAEDLGVPVSSLAEEMDTLEILGIGNIDECRKFVAFCLEQEAVPA